MGLVTLCEGRSLGLPEWGSCLGIDATTLKHLIHLRILRETISGDFVLSFAGIVIFSDRVLFAKPKFGDEIAIDLGGLLRVLRAYFTRSASRRPTLDYTRDPEFGSADVLREFDALIGLQEWFYAHGLYRSEQTRSSDRGRPHWVKTVARAPALVMQGSVVYPSTVGVRTEGVLNDISALQASLLRLLLLRYGFPVPAAIRNAELATGAAIDKWPLDEDARKYYQRRLQIEQRNVYRSDTLRLFKILRELLGTQLAEPTAQAQIYGTTAFYSVWEDACRTGVAQDLDPASVTSIGQPTWWVPESGGKSPISQGQTPDLIVLRDEWLLVLDAKYYFPFPQGRPGGPDIIKQVYYAESLGHTEGKVLSVFLLPRPGAKAPEFLGYATIEGAQRAFDRVEAWGLDPELLLRDYPNLSPSRSNSLIDFIVASRSRVNELVDQPPTGVGN
ncbi:LlaJI family restriction endonuclease [Thermomonas carbonis]|uniref:LlaJI family restriction endonuclease n=1 Tax=Thermomonas carbonis TaxID=1463158 RepID=A0A7G9SLN7_9GAMM|nr:LlaJI family restriction endonuclease [Thermomonas carbonis]QNN68762.1 LlaJI family restriction endonuclease [Thermomonas carbonis]GHC08945.1 hypothetical protein GCM10010080_25030 [Thermomonas carbonis]